MHNPDSNCDNVVFCEEEAIETSCAEIINRNKADRDTGTDQTTGSAVFLGKIRILGTETPSDQGDCRCLQPVSEGEGERHNIHADLMGCHGVSSLICCHNRRHHKANPHQYLLEEHTVADMDQIFECQEGRADFMFYNIRNADKIIFFQNGKNTHNARNNGSADCS